MKNLYRYTMSLMLILPSITLAASFDCTKASTVIEQLICDNSVLSELDSALGKNYSRMMAGNIGDGARDHLQKSQRQWLRERNACADLNCLTEKYISRIDEICEYPVISGLHPICIESDDVMTSVSSDPHNQPQANQPVQSTLQPKYNREILELASFCAGFFRVNHYEHDNSGCSRAVFVMENTSNPFTDSNFLTYIRQCHSYVSHSALIGISQASLNASRAHSSEIDAIVVSFYNKGESVSSNYNEAEFNSAHAKCEEWINFFSEKFNLESSSSR